MIAAILCFMTQSPCIFSNASEQQSLISRDRITKYENNIEVLLKNRVYYRGAFTATKIWMGTCAAVQGIANTINTAAWLAGYNQPITMSQDLHVSESKKEWLVKSVLSVLGTLGFYYLFAKAEQQYGAAPDIRWFVTVKSPFYITLRELYFLAQEVPTTKEPQQLCVEMKKRFDKLINQTEQVVAFMRYKQRSFSPKKKLEAEHVINHLLERIEPLYREISDAIATDAYNVTFHLDSVLILLEGDCSRFSHVEGGHWINPSAVLDIMQNLS